MGGGGSKKQATPAPHGIVPTSTTQPKASSVVEPIPTVSTTTATATKLDKHLPPPMDKFRSLIESGKVIPCESHGPYYLEKYHPNVDGTFYGFSSHREWENNETSNRTKLEKCVDNPIVGGSWSNVDITKFDAKWVMDQGFKVFGEQFEPGPTGKHRDMLEGQRKEMVAQYAAAAERVKKREPKIFDLLMNDDKYKSFGNKVLQPLPCKGTDPFVALYTSALSALPPLWELSKKTAEAATSAGPGVNGCNGGDFGDPGDTSATGPATKAELSWGLKKLRRVKYKVTSKYQNDPRKVTDMARTSIVFPTLETLRFAMDFLLGHRDFAGTEGTMARVVLVKNRFREPASGYCDVLMNVVMNESGGDDGGGGGGGSVCRHVCEVQLHIKSIYDTKKEGGHKAYKWFRLLTVGGKLESYTKADGSSIQLDYKYIGPRDADGLPSTFGSGGGGEGQSVQEGQGGATHYKGGFLRIEGEERSVHHGRGTEWSPDGSCYSGEWCKDLQHGIGTKWYKSGNVYSGNFFEGTKQPSKVGIYWWANGNVGVVTGFVSEIHPSGPGLLCMPNQEEREEREEREENGDVESWLLFDDLSDTTSYRAAGDEGYEEELSNFLKDYDVRMPLKGKPVPPSVPELW